MTEGVRKNCLIYLLLTLLEKFKNKKVTRDINDRCTWLV